MNLKLVLLPALFWTLVSGDNFPVLNGLDEISNLTKASDEGHRLPNVLDPIHFEVEITPYFEATANNDIFTFDGIVTIIVKALQDITGHFVIHENVRDILDASVVPYQATEELSTTTERIRNYQFFKINLRPEVTLRKDDLFTVRVRYIGNINETPLSRGVFRGSYVNKKTGKQHYYLATHLQPTHSRQFFPCFDEPGYKSTFTMIVNRPLHFTETYANMPIDKLASQVVGDRYREVFYPTPRMSAYLVTIHVSEEFTVIADNLSTERSYRILARPDADGQGEWALEVGVKLTKWFEDYLGIPYYTMAENMKNDQIASPDWASGATENWGLVTYRELRLLYEEGETNAIDKMSIGTITAHELAHKWFGNLITAKWWDNVWINEGYASYFEYFAMHGVYKEMELEDQFNLLYLQTALSADAARTTRALRHSVNSPEEVSGHFTGISYSKGASFLMMLNHFLTPNVFQKALRNFLLNRQYNYADPEHVYDAFTAAVDETNALEEFKNTNIAAFMKAWVDEPGSPVVKATRRSDGKIDLEQERFYYDGSLSTGNQVWPIPITIATKSKPTFNNRRATQIMTTKKDVIDEQVADDEWIVLNVQQSGIYRVDYDNKNWGLLTEALKNNRDDIHYLNRAQIVDDVFAFMRSERLSFKDGFKILEFLRSETNFFVWHAAISGFTFLRNRFFDLDTIGRFGDLLLKYLDNVINNLGYNEANSDNLIRIRNRFSVMSLACSLRHEGCLLHARDTFEDFISKDVSVNPNIRRHVYCYGLLAGDYNTWKKMYDLLLKSNNQADEIVILRALGCTEDSNAVNSYLETILSEVVRVQDRVNAFSYLFSGHRDNAKRALPFIKSRHNNIRTALVGFSSVLSSLANNLDEAGLKDMENWLEENKSTLPEYTSGMNAIKTARDNIQWGRDNSKIILDAMMGSATVSLPTITMILTALFAVFFK